GRDMLEGVAAAHDVGREVGVTLVVEILDELQLRQDGRLQAAGDVGRIDTDAPGHALPDHEGEELALAAADLQHALPGELILPDPAAGKGPGKRIEGR